MLPRQLAPVQDLESLKKMRHGMIIGNTRRRLRIEILLGISLGTMKIGREQGVLAQEERDIVEEIEARIGRVVEETTMETEDITEETTVPVEENTAQIGKVEGTIVPDTGRETAGQETEGIIHQKRAEDTLAIIDEVVAKGPLVMEGP